MAVMGTKLAANARFGVLKKTTVRPHLDIILLMLTARKSFGEVVKDSKAAILRANDAGADFLLVDSEIALTFSSLARETTNLEKKRRTSGAARKAYDSIERLRRRIKLDDRQADKLNATLVRLKSELLNLGETF